MTDQRRLIDYYCTVATHRSTADHNIVHVKYPFYRISVDLIMRVILILSLLSL